MTEIQQHTFAVRLLDVDIPAAPPAPLPLYRSKSQIAAALESVSQMTQAMVLAAPAPVSRQASTDHVAAPETPVTVVEPAPAPNTASQPADTARTEAEQPGAAAEAAAPAPPTVDVLDATVPVPALKPATPGPETVCALCFVPAALQRVGHASERESFSKDAVICEHETCEDCIVGWVKAHVDEGRAHIRCPLPDCKFVMYPDDIRFYVPEELWERFKQLRERDFAEQKTALLADAEIMAFISETNCRFCPGCNVLIQRSEGCDYMACTCGYEFCYQCENEINSCYCNN